MNNLDWLLIFLADYLIFLLFLLAIILRVVKVKLPLVMGFSTAALSGLIAAVIKNLFFFPRPFILSGQLPLIDLIMDGSFPSSHTAVSFGLAFPVFLKNRSWGSVFIGLALLIALGRAGSGVHTYRDLVGGFTLAVICTLMVHFLAKRIRIPIFRD